MISIDLITGFLGSGKTTFMIAYAQYLVHAGNRVGIIVNDLGAVNVDMMLLSSQLEDCCTLEMITYSPDKVTYQRRLKTKLIALGMQGFDRVLIEPSGVFDIETFFDVLYESPLDQWYEIGNVLALVDASLPMDLSSSSRAVLASEIACAGKIILTHLDQADHYQLEQIQGYMQYCLQEVHCERCLSQVIIAQSIQAWSIDDWERIKQSGYETPFYQHRPIDLQQSFRALYFFELKCDLIEMKDLLATLFSDERYGHVFRVKGFIQDDQLVWYQINATAKHTTFTRTSLGQAVLIIIGEELQEKEILTLLNGGR